MVQSSADEFIFDPGIEDAPLPAEFGEYGGITDFGAPAPEETVPLEIPVTLSEQETGGPDIRTGAGAGENLSKSKKTRHEIVKKIMYVMIASVVAGVTMIYSSFGVDPLGSDFLVKGLFPPSGSSSTTPVTPGSSSFPKLPNLNPEYAGNYAWSGLGSEEYILINNTTYIVAGTAFTTGGALGTNVTPGTVPGAVYDSATNTLTLTNFTGSSIETNLMGNGFTIELVGGNSLDHLSVWGASYGGSVTFTGTGTLVLNKGGGKGHPVGDAGLYLACEESASCVMIDKGVTLDIYGQNAIIIEMTTLEQAIYTLDPIVVTGGTLQKGNFVEKKYYLTDENGNLIVDENGEFVTKTMTTEDVAKQEGIALYDYSVVDETGRPSQHVLFTPAVP